MAFFTLEQTDCLRSQALYFPPWHLGCTLWHMPLQLIIDVAEARKQPLSDSWKHALLSENRLDDLCYSLTDTIQLPAARWYLAGMLPFT